MNKDGTLRFPPASVLGLIIELKDMDSIGPLLRSISMWTDQVRYDAAVVAAKQRCGSSSSPVW